ncbi:MAG: HAD-IIA family hydrolase [Thermomicrobiales bacterium]|nr:HAD-IIA family hydrolase [Thermomicrobiales bacterium]
MLKDVRGFIFDIDGVLHITMRPIPGAPEFFGALRERGVPHRFLTNSTIATCATLARRLQSMGFGIPEESILTASRATAEYVAAHFPGQPCYLLATGDTVDEFRDAGVELVDVDTEPEAPVIVIGGAEDELTFARLDHVYRLLLRGSKLIGMHRNTAWMTAKGMTLDSGPFISALEQAAGVEATIIGKPSLPIFRQSIEALGIPAKELAMVGDDAYNDLVPARELGMTTILVRTGKPVGPSEEALADITLDSVGDILRLLDNTNSR